MSTQLLKVQLAYGKFDPDLNPPPFSDWSKAFTAVEIDLVQFFLWKPKVIQYFNQWVKKKELSIIPRFSVRTQRERSEYEDLIQIWNESFASQTLYYSVYSGRKKWDLDLSLKELKKLPLNEKSYFFEWAQDDRSLNTIELQSLESFGGFVVDPDWHAKHLSKMNDVSLRFKLHGWNEQRWVRRYGEANSAKIKRIVGSKEDASLVLSYSGKVEEASLFT